MFESSVNTIKFHTEKQYKAFPATHSETLFFWKSCCDFDFSFPHPVRHYRSVCRLHVTLIGFVVL